MGSDDKRLTLGLFRRHSFGEAMNRSLLRTGGIIAAFIVGYFLPCLHSLEWMIRWMVMLMLFITFLHVRFNRLKIRRQHFYLVAVNLGLALGFWALMQAIGWPLFAVMAFFIAITPTASAAPVIMGFLKGDVEFVLTSLIFSTLLIGALLPFLMPIVIGHSAPGLTLDMGKSILLVLGVPMLTSIMVRRAGSRMQGTIDFLSKIQFPIWVFTLLLIAGSGSHFIRSHTEIDASVFGWMALLAAVICVLSFGIGYLIGRPNLSRECSQSLGQKNTTLTIYLAMTYASPLAGLAVTFYVVFHNLWNAIQIQRQGRRDLLEKSAINKEEEILFSEES